jgi:hypothetical protein
VLRHRLLLSILALLALVSSLPLAPARADEEIPPRSMTRKFPAGTFCVLPVRIQFTASETAVRVFFDAQVYVDDGGNLVWTHQWIDNVTLATKATVDANIHPPPASGESQSCYTADGDPLPTDYFYFNTPGLTLQLKETFDTDPTARGWDMSNGGYFDPLESAPRDVEVETEDPIIGGSLGLGLESPTPSLSQIATSSIDISGLSPGTQYELGAWWQAQFVKYPHDVDYLTVRIETIDGTPIAKKSWGSVKSSYR